MADQLGLETIDREGDRVVFRFGQKTPLDPARLVTFVERRKDVTLVPPAGMRLDLKQGAGGAEGTRAAGRARGAQSAPGATRSAGLAPGRPTERSRRPPQSPVAPASWWTARATAGEVTAGFTKAEILKPQAEDPRGPSGVFTRVGGLLSELLP